MDLQILTPAAALVLWSLIMLIWMASTRFPAAAKANIDIASRVGKRGQDLEGVIPDRVNWKAHNYTHLMEQPTIFYPTVLILAVTGAGQGISLWFAWAYVVIRIIHSIWQATVNKLPVRTMLFLLSTLCLLVLAIKALLATL